MNADIPMPADDCHTVAEMLIAYLDDEATAADSARVAAHLDMCARCGLEAETVLALKVSTAQHAEGGEPDPEAVERLRQFAQALESRAHHVSDS